MHAWVGRTSLPADSLAEHGEDRGHMASPTPSSHATAVVRTRVPRCGGAIVTRPTTCRRGTRDTHPTQCIEWRDGAGTSKSYAEQGGVAEPPIAQPLEFLKSQQLCTQANMVAGRGATLATALWVGVVAVTALGPVAAIDVVVQTQYGAIAGAPAANGTIAFLGVPYAAPPVGPLRWKSPVPPTPWPTVLDTTQQASVCTQPQNLAVPNVSSGRCVAVWRGWGLRRCVRVCACVGDIFSRCVCAFPHHLRPPSSPSPTDRHPSPTSEDCLYLDVYAPQNSAGSLPVMVCARVSLRGWPSFGTLSGLGGPFICVCVCVWLQVFIHGGGYLICGASTPLYQSAELAATGPAVVVLIQYRLGLFGCVVPLARWA